MAPVGEPFLPETEPLSTLPFLKWAGGKRWFAENHLDLVPSTYDRYIEPFAGSAAVFFALKPGRAVLADKNTDLINTYRAVKENWQLVVRYLTNHSTSHGKKHYYQTRANSPHSLYTRAARFIYLNRTCWNGLYRVNTQGQFNVPIGTRSSVLRESDQFEEVAHLLRNTDLQVADFETTINSANKEDLLFVDPPYTVNHNNNGFLKYNETIFNWADQIRLRDSLVRAKSRGVKVVLTNALHESVRSLYRSVFKIRSLARSSTIASSSDNRRLTEELLIVG